MSNSEFFITILIVSVIATLLFVGLPEELEIKFMMVYIAFNKDSEKYNFEKTLKNHQMFSLFFLLYSLSILLLAHILNREIPNAAIWMFFILALIGSFWLNPVKRKQ